MTRSLRRSPWLGLALLVAFAGPTAAYDYRVRQGDTLADLAGRFGVSMAVLREVNGLTGSTIVAGRALTIPEGPGGVRVHRVQPGDTLAHVAERYGASGVRVARASRLANVDLLAVGSLLVIPADATPDGGLPLPGPRPVSAPARTASSGTSGAFTLNGRAVTAAEVEVLARIVKGEVPHDAPFEGMVAVAAVVLNRARSGDFPRTITGVAHQPWQFSCYNPDVRARLYEGPIPAHAWRAARAALRGEDPSGGATFYFNPYLVRPSWADDLVRTRRIGETSDTTHDFYRPRRRGERAGGIVDSMD